MPKSREVSFTVTRSERQFINQIAVRAAAMALHDGIKYPILAATMDITAVHANGNRLRLEELLAADPANFAHDIYGIRRFLDRETDKLTGFFVPRYSEPKG